MSVRAVRKTREQSRTDGNEMHTVDAPTLNDIWARI